VAGEALVDELPAPSADARPLLRPGGSPYNVAIGLARLQVPVALHAAVGGDDAGRLLRDHAARNGVDVTRLRAVAEPTMRASVVVDSVGEARYRFNVPDCAALRWRSDRDALADSPAILRAGSIVSWLSPSAGQIEQLAHRAAARGIALTFDPNIRPALLGADADRRDARARVEHLAALADLVKVSAADLRWLYPHREPVRAAAQWSTRAGLVLLTDGPAAAVACRDGDVIARRSAAAVAVRDTIGAGDAFMAAALARLASSRGGGNPSDVRALAADPGQVEALLDFGHAAAAITCGRVGADPPTSADLATRTPAVGDGRDHRDARGASERSDG